MSNIYVQANEVYRNVSTLRGFTAANFEIVRSQEQLLEKLSVMALIPETVKDLVNLSGIDVKKLASGRISKATTEVITSKTTNDVQLINLFPITNEVYEKVKHLPTVKAICGDPDNKIDFAVHENSRSRFMNGLAMFVARQILIVKFQLGEVLDSKVYRAVDLFRDAYDGKRGMYIAFHQITNKLVAGGIDKDEAKRALVEVCQEKVDRLAEYVRANFGGYLVSAASIVRQNSLLSKGA